jgi:FAD/FMN-containing dehydrogenase
VPRPFAGTDAGAFVLLACAGRSDPTEELTGAVAAADNVMDAVIATEATDRRRLWHLREAHTEAISAQGVAHKLDVSVPADRLAAFVDWAGDVVRRHAPGARMYAFGHLAEANLHLSILGLDADDRTVEDELCELVLSVGGSISAEHGIGVAKARWMERIHSPAHLATLRALKRAFDPQGLLNPGVLVDP